MLGWEVIPRIPIGDFGVSPHGVGIAVGYFIGASLMARRARRTGFNEDHAWNAAVVGVLGAIVGARTAYIIGHSEQFSNPIEYLQIYKGGISLVGGLIGGFLAAFLYCKRRGLDYLRLTDLGAPGLAIGTAVGRIGDLVIGDHLGRTTEGFWGWEYQGGELISSPPCDTAVYPSVSGCIEPGMVVHQTAIYDSVWSLIIFGILMRLDRKPRPKGFLTLTWAALYFSGRIATDFTRVDKTWFDTGLTGSQLVAIAVVIISVAGLVKLRKTGATEPKSTPGEEAEEAPGESPDGDSTTAAPVEEDPTVVQAPVEPVHEEAPKAGDSTSVAPVEERTLVEPPVHETAPEAVDPEPDAEPATAPEDAATGAAKSEPPRPAQEP